MKLELTSNETTSRESYFQLDSFEGPLDLLLHLVHKKEIEIYQVAIHEITQQYLHHLNTLMKYDLEIGAEFLNACSSLIYLKSKMLLPKEVQEEETIEENMRFEILEHLLHYYQFRQIADNLEKQEIRQDSFFVRGIEETDNFSYLEPSPLSSLDLKQLTKTFSEILQNAKNQPSSPIFEEKWRVPDKILEWKSWLKNDGKISFNQVFHSNRPKEELITLFLALLELIKLGKALIDIQQDTGQIDILRNYGN